MSRVPEGRLSRLSFAERKKWTGFRDFITIANINTIHGFCASLIKDNFALLGLDPGFGILEEVDSKTKLMQLAQKIIEEYLLEPGNTQIADAVLNAYSSSIVTSGELSEDIIAAYKNAREKDFELSKLRDLTISRHKAASDVEGQGGGEVPPGLNELEIMAAELILKLHERYKTFKEKEAVLDFNDLELLADKLLENEDIRNRYFQLFRYFLVDEFQDVNQIRGCLKSCV
ncbi:MAG: UvrD-helicase domain-containing protein [Clostridia bacterium]|nr:UvrD-helicase domain-containing protein [Clostridia bacterium]